MASWDREENSNLKHNIPIGALVEVKHNDSPQTNDGIRLFVVSHDRDCDMTPLYSLSIDPYDTVRPASDLLVRWHTGYLERSLLVIKRGIYAH